MARKTKSTIVPEAPEVPVASPVSGQAAPVPEAVQESNESQESKEPEAAKATPEPKESGKPVSTPPAPKPARPLQPTVKDELDDPFGMVGFLD